MIDDTTLELLSRSLDEDLSVDEARALEQLLEESPEAREELEALRMYRGVVSESALRMEPPAELDALLEPLRRAAPEPRRIRPVMQWMAAAAVVVIGLTVGLEVAKRRPIQEVLDEESVRAPASERLSTQREGYFQLQPLPTAPPDEEELVGAVEHLMAAPVEEPAVEEPRALEIMGPLTASEGAREASDVKDAGADEARQNRVQAMETDVVSDGESRAPGRSQVSEQKASSAKMARAGAASSGAEGNVVEATLVFAAEDGGMAIPCSAPAGTPPGLWWLTVIVEDDQIVGCVADENSDKPGATVCSAVQELEVAGLTSGEYRARFVIPGPHSDPR